MSGDDDNFVSRWSRRKIAARSGKTLDRDPPNVTPSQDGAPNPAQAGTREMGTPAETETSVPLPAIESLTPESDFTAFMKSDVDPAVRRDAMKVLMRDPRFNVMDGLDVYIDDYSKPDPLPEGWLEKLNMMKRLGSFVEEAEAGEEPAADPAGELQKQMPEQALQQDAERISSGTKIDGAADDGVTESGIAGGKLPRNEA